MSARGVWASLLVAGCASPWVAPPRPRPVVAEEAPAPESARRAWGRVLSRACRGTLAPPVVAPDASRFVYCDATFGFETGDYRGRVAAGVIAWLAGGEVLRHGAEAAGLIVSALDGSGVKRSGGDFVVDAVISPDGSQVAVVQAAAARAAVVVYRLPGLERVALAKLADGDARVGFDDDGVLVWSRGDGSVSRLGGDGLKPLFDGVAQLVVAAGGTRALVEGRDGSRDVIALPSATREEALPVAAEDHPWMAIDAAGRRVAYYQGDDLVVAALEADGLVELHREARLGPAELSFSADGATLFADVDGGREVVVLREGAPSYARPTPSYEPVVPAGFAAVIIEHDEGMPVLRDRENGEVVHEEPLSPALVARYEGGDGVIVSVSALDPREYGAGADWAARLAERECAAADAGAARSWGSPGARSLELAWYARGCEVGDHYVRFSEHAGALYRVDIEARAGTGPGELTPAFRAFFDEPFGTPAAVLPGRLLRGSQARPLQTFGRSAEPAARPLTAPPPMDPFGGPDCE